MRDHATRRQIPVDQSIHWKPLHDSHYVVASLQPGDGGRRPIFVKQQVLARIEALVKAHGRRSVGLLIGQFYHCQATGADYIIAESVEEQPFVGDETDMAATISEAMAGRAPEHRAHVLGWYRGAANVDSRPSPITVSTHTAAFTQPWQIILVVGEGLERGAVFLRDSVNARWFNAPFYELLDNAPTPPQAKGTVIDWPHHYITAEHVEPAGTEVWLAAEFDERRTRSRYERPKLDRSAPDRPVAKEAVVDPGPPPPAPPPSAASPADVGVPLFISETATPVLPQAVAQVPEEPAAGPPVPDVPVMADRPAPQPLHRGLADVPQAPARERTLPRKSHRSTEKLSIVDDRDQSMLPASRRRFGDTDDTTAGDDPGRYIELARAEGFFIAAKFDTTTGLSPSESLWVLNEPYSGMLLSVVATDSEVIDATLHYNLQTDEAGLRKVPFAAHRDSESKTIYVRETCVDSLRARCRRLRATNALLKEWKVAPKISFLTPGEWESIPSFNTGVVHGADTVNQLNTARIAELPPGVRSQFHLAGEGTAETGEANA